LLRGALLREKKTVCLRVHPENDNMFGRKARVFLLSKGKSAHFASALFYMMDVLRSISLYSWRQVDYAIFVRYLMGTAYLPAPLHIFAYTFFSVIVPKSNYLFFLDVRPEEAVERITENRATKEMFETMDALKKVRAKSLRLTSYDKWIILDANKPADQVAYTLKMALSQEAF
jgi:dTMP kinase